jgi:endonuclease/exonuclease/phosphatase family metal-dependent hydrolase
MWRIPVLFLVLIHTATAADLHIATWNLEWLVSPATAHASRLACDRGKRAKLPCDVARGSRDSADFARLAAYARRLDADIVAFQEVEDAAVAARIFRGYRICMAGGQGVQHTGFAVRKQLPHHCGEPLTTLAAGGRHRHGAVLTALPGTPAAFTLLVVHLKSGCSTAPLDSSSSCETLAAQGQALAGWIGAEQQRGARFMVLGDFNRAGPDDDDPFWSSLQRDSRTSLRNAARGEPFHNCFVGQPFWQFIDHILLSPALAPRLVPRSFRKMGYESLDALRYRLSDHCPVSIRVSTPIDKR